MLPTKNVPLAGSWAMKGIAHDPASGTFFVGSIYKRKIVAISREGVARDLVAPAADDLHKTKIISDTAGRSLVRRFRVARPSRPSHSGRRTSSSTAQASVGS